MKKPALFIEVTRRCTNACIYCGSWRSTGTGENDLTLEQYIKLFQILKEERIFFPRINFTGGEPTLRRDIKNIVSAAINIIGGEIHFTTNGSYILEQKSLWELPISLVKVNINTLDPVAYKKITGTDNLRKVIKGIDYLISKKVSIRLHSVLLMESLPFIYDLIQYCRNGGIDLKLFQIDTDLSSKEKQPVDIADVEYYLEKFYDTHVTLESPGLPIHVYKNKKNEIHLVKSGLQPYNVEFCRGCISYPCDYGLYSVSVDPEGFAYPCLIQHEKGKEKLDLQSSKSVKKVLIRLCKIIEDARILSNVMG